MALQNHPETCPVCKKGGAFSFVMDYKKDEGSFSLYQCGICQVQLWAPIKKIDAGWYEEGVGYKLRGVLGPRIFRGYHKRFLKKYQNVKNATILDLGCGDCGFLGALQKRGWQVWGVDFNRDGINAGIKNFGLKNVFSMDFDDFFSKKGLPKFDFITFFEVIEHVSNPIDFIEKAAELLKPNGKIILSTPSRERMLVNLNSWDFPPHHFTRWNQIAIANIFKETNLKIVSTEYIEQFKTIMEAVNGKLGFGMVNKAIHLSAKKDGSSFLLPKAIYVMGRVKEMVTGYLPASFLYVIGKINRRKNGIMFVELK